MVIGGSTASGKSALALALARATGGTVVNADSQQLFRDLPTLTARPTPGDEALAPHRLYGLLGPDEQPSLGRWLALVGPVLREPMPGPVVLTGGGGLYLEALLRGVAAVPDIPGDLRAALRAEAEAVPAAAMHERLRALDPVMAGRLRPGDRQRTLRALEVVLATGRSLALWQAGPPAPRPPLPGPVVGVGLLPPAAVANPRIERRLRAMLEGGAAAAEVRGLAAHRPDLARLPIAKVHGCRELLAVAEGRLDPAAAEASVAAQVRRYAKRQRTFFGRRLPELERLPLTGEDPAALARVTMLLDRARP